MRNVLILKFPHSSLFGGGERHTLTIVEELQRSNFVFWLAGSCPVLRREFRKRGWRQQRWWAGLEPVSIGALLLWPLTAPLAAFGLVVLLLYYRMAQRVTRLYCLSLTEKILATVPARIFGMKVFWIEHVPFDRWLTRNPLRLLYRWLSRFVTVVAVSNAVRDQLVNELGVDADRVRRIYSGVNLTKFGAPAQRWDPGHRYNIGTVVRLSKEKGVEFLIQAVKLVREFVPVARLIVVGDGPERKKLTWLAERLELKEHVQWVGHQANVEKWYGYFDAFVLPSVGREAFGMVLLEAMASRIPTVGSKLGGIQEIITHRITGMLAEPSSSQSIADQLLYLYNNRMETNQIVDRAQQRVRAEFGLERMVRDYFALLR